MAETRRARKSGTTYLALDAGEDIAAIQEDVKAYRAELAAAREAEEAARQGKRQARELQEREMRKRVAELNSDALRHFTTTILPTGEALHITQLTNFRGETAVYMFTARQEKPRFGLSDGKLETRLDYASYEDRYRQGAEFYQRGTATGENIVEALLNLIC